MMRLATLTLMILFFPAATLAQTCAERALAVAEEFGLAADVPMVPPDDSLDEPLGEVLAESGGVLAPPDEGTVVVIEPPAVDPGMPTAPGAVPGGASEPEATATLHTQAEALLRGAVEAERTGDPARCEARLAEALALLSDAGTLG